MAKTKRKPHKPEIPTQGDVGPDTPAQWIGAEKINYEEPNGAKFRRKRRAHALEIMRGRGEIDARQCAAGIALHEEFCETEKSSPSAFTKVYVDTSPDYGSLVLSLAERRGGFGDMYYAVPKAMRGPLNHCAILGLTLRVGNEYVAPYSRDSAAASAHCAQLQVALDILANHLSI